MITFAKPGDFCPNESCPKYRQLEENPVKPNIIKAGKTKAGVQRYECKTCHQTFTETKGTLFYRKQTPASEILETLALLAEGDRVSSLTRVKGIKEDTILGWMRDAAQHTEMVVVEGFSDRTRSTGWLVALHPEERAKKRAVTNVSVHQKIKPESSCAPPCSTSTVVCELQPP